MKNANLQAVYSIRLFKLHNCLPPNVTCFVLISTEIASYLAPVGVTWAANLASSLTTRSATGGTFHVATLH